MLRFGGVRGGGGGKRGEANDLFSFSIVVMLCFVSPQLHTQQEEDQ